MNELYHHGILGQRWGVRRFQNKDGTLTAAGRKRHLQQHQYYIKGANDALTNEKEKRAKYLDKEAETYNKAMSYSKKHAESEAEMFKNLERLENGFEVHNKETKLWKEYEKAHSDLQKSEANIANIKSFLKGISGEPMNMYEFAQGEKGRILTIQYLNSVKEVKIK